MILLIPQSEGRPEDPGSSASAFLDSRSAYDRNDQDRLNLNQLRLPGTSLKESHGVGVSAMNRQSQLDKEIDQLLSKVQAGRLSPDQLKTANREDQALAEGWEAVTPRDGTRGAELLTKLRTRVAVREAVLQRIQQSPLTLDSLQAQVVQEANTESANGAYLRRRRRARRHAKGRGTIEGLIQEATSPEDLCRRLIEFNSCHSSADGKFCSGSKGSNRNPAARAALRAGRKAKAAGGDWRKAAGQAYIKVERKRAPDTAFGVQRGYGPAATYLSRHQDPRGTDSWHRTTHAGAKLMARSLQRRRLPDKMALSDESMAHMHKYNVLQMQRRAKRFAR